MPTIPILNAGWTQYGVSAFTWHDHAIPPIPPLPTPLKVPASPPGLIEGPVPMGWPLGFITHKKAMKVNADGNPAIQTGHDIGYVIPHFAIPMHVLLAIFTLLSKHKPPYPVSKVKIEGKEAGSYLFFLLGIICANPVSLPTGVVLLFKCTVWTSFSIMDLLKCLLNIAIDIIFDLLWNKITGKFKWLKPSPFRTPQALDFVFAQGFRQLLPWAMTSTVGRYLLAETGNRVIQHIIKSWVVGPLVTGLPKGTMGLGRGRASVKFF